jgi:hypothetical protein
VRTFSGQHHVSEQSLTAPSVQVGAVSGTA